MKKRKTRILLLTIAAFLFSNVFYSQFKIDTLNAVGEFSQVFEIKGVKKSELHQRTNEWIAINFKDSNETLKLNTEDKIITKGYFNIETVTRGIKVPQKLFFIMEIGFKDERFRVYSHSFAITTVVNNQNIEIPYSNYLSCLEHNNYVAYLNSQLDENNTAGYLSNRQIRKAYEKILKNEKSIEESRLNAMIYEKQISSQINLNVNGLAKSLFKYNSTTTENW